MTLDELQDWLLSGEGLGAEFERLARFAAVSSLNIATPSEDLVSYRPDWYRLLLASSILAKGEKAVSDDAALLTAQAGLLYSKRPDVVDASATILKQLANSRAIALAEKRGFVARGLEGRLGITERLLFTKRELTQAIFLPKSSTTIDANAFQRKFWNQLREFTWVSASAPTASGKTYLVLQWLLNEFATAACTLAVFVAPTRALVGEIESQLLALASEHELHSLRVASLPITELGDRSRPTILVFTQERLHVFLNGFDEIPKIDVIITDEAHKVGDDLRGVIMQDALERVLNSNRQSRFIFLSPLTANPEVLVEDAPSGARTSVLPSETQTVTQNLIIARQKPRDAALWELQLRRHGTLSVLGEIRLHARPDSQAKRLSYIATALGRGQSGTLVYVNGAAEAEKVAWQIYGAMESSLPEELSLDDELKELSDFARDTVHPQFQLVELLKRRIAFHYGNMPTLLRSEIERLFRSGKIKFLVCTSTLIEGVNLACRTIVVRGPRKGNGHPMGPHDFWNLAGRAGRWGQDFCGNIVCVDVDRRNLWPNGVPARTRYPIERETDAILHDENAVKNYISTRLSLPPQSIQPSLEQLLAYLLTWKVREGSLASAPAAKRLSPDYVRALDHGVTQILSHVDVGADIISHHPGVSAIALQGLLNYFRDRSKPIEEVIPASPESDDSHASLVAVFHRINRHLYPAFTSALIPVHALVTVEWMRGLPLSQIIRQRIKWLTDHHRPIDLPDLIRRTMRDVEEVARFKAPKFLSAYLDVLKFHLTQIGRSDLFPDNLRFDLYLEFGVATKTLLSLIGIGLSRTSAVAINDYFANPDLSESDVIARLGTAQWRVFSLPSVVKREIERVISQQRPLAQ